MWAAWILFQQNLAMGGGPPSTPEVEPPPCTRFTADIGYTQRFTVDIGYTERFVVDFE